MSKLKKVLKKQKGFTLVELIVVIAIIGILAAVAVPNLTGFTKSAEAVAEEATQKTIQSAVDMYYIDHDNTYPTSNGNDGTIKFSELTDYLDDEPEGTWTIDGGKVKSGSNE